MVPYLARGRRGEAALLALGLAVVVAFSGVAVGVNRKALSRVEAINEQNRLHSQRMLARLLQGYLASELTALNTRAQGRTWSMQPGDRRDAAAVREIQDRLAPSSAAVVLVTPLLTPVASAGDRQLVPALTDPGWDSLRDGLTKHGAGVSSVMVVRGEPVVAFAVPLLRDGKPVGLLVDVEKMKESDLADYARSLELGGSAGVAIVDARRRVVASNARDDVGREASGLPDGVFTARMAGLAPIERDGARRVAVYAPVQAGGWVVVVEQSADEFYGGVRSSGRRVELFFFALVILAAFVVVVVNSRRHAALAQLAEGARRDPLTGLPNRRVFQERLAARPADRAGGAVLFCDLDNFKAVNDTYGHDAGDALLLVVAERLRSCVRPGDVVSRLGGDEFTVLLDGAGDVDEALVIAHRIVASLADPIQLPQTRLAGVGVSCGVALLDDPDTVRATLHAADLAMYRAKQAGGGIAVADAVSNGTVDVSSVGSPAPLVPAQPAPPGARALGSTSPLSLPPGSTPPGPLPPRRSDPETGFAGRPGGPVA